jgi:hypothetical protein
MRIFIAHQRSTIEASTSSAQRVDRGRRDDSFDAARELRVQGHERVCLQLSQRDVFRVVGRGPSKLIRDLPGSAPEHGVAEEPDRHPPDASEVVARDVCRDLAPLHGLVQSRQRLGTKECRCEKLVLVGDLDLVTHEVENGAGVDDEPGQRRHNSCPQRSISRETTGAVSVLVRRDPMRQAIRLGVLQPGDQLPTVKEVVGTLAINPA